MRLVQEEIKHNDALNSMIKKDYHSEKIGSIFSPIF